MHGTPATGSDCPIDPISNDGPFNCASCDAGFKRYPNIELGTQRGNTANGPVDYLPYICERDTPCYCTNGVPRTGDDCEPGPVASGGLTGCISCNPGYNLVEQPGSIRAGSTEPYSTNYLCWPGGPGTPDSGCDPADATASPRCCRCRTPPYEEPMYGDDCTEEQSPHPEHPDEGIPMYWCARDDDSGGVGAGGIVLIVLAVLVSGAFAGYFFVASKRRSSNHDDKKNPEP